MALFALLPLGTFILFIGEIEGKFLKSFKQKTTITHDLCDNEINLSEAENRSDNEKSNTENGKIADAQITVNSTKEYPELYEALDWYCNRDSSVK